MIKSIVREILMYEIVNQMFNGKKKRKDVHEKNVYKTSMELAKHYNIFFDEDSLIPSDLSMADSVYFAALDLVEKTGFFAIDTMRIVKPKTEETIDAMRNIRSPYIVGKGFDSIFLSSRKILDKRPPTIWGGPCSAPVSEEYFIPIHRSYAKLNSIDILAPASLVDNLSATLRNTPLELYNAYHSINMIKEACALENRPDMCYSIPPSIVDIQSALSIANYTLTGKETIHEIYNAPDLKVNLDSITKAIHCGRLGLPYSCDQFVILGGDTISSPEQMAIMIVAEAIKCRTLNASQIYLHAPIDAETGASSTARILWASAIASMALSRNTDLLHGQDITTSAGPCTEMMLYETAVQTISNVVCGADLLAGPSANSLQMIDHAGGLDALFMSKVASLATTLSLEDANHLCMQLYEKYKNFLSRPDIGKHFSECYDVKKIEPSLEYSNVCKKIFREINSIAR